MPQRLICRWCGSPSHECIADPCMARQMHRHDPASSSTSFTMSGNEGGDDLPTDNTTTETTEVPETERVTINELCQQLLADRSTDFDTRQLAASIVANERQEPMGLIDFMGAVGLRALLHSRSNYGQDHTRRMLTRMAFNVQSFGRIAQTIGFQPPHACVRCGTSMGIGVTCGNCAHRLNTELQRRLS